jgi:hypothetical protein
MVILWNKKEILERSELWKSVLGSKPGEDGFCILEGKHDKRTLPRPKLFVLVRLQEQWSHPQKSVLDLNPGEDGFVA